MHTVAKTFLAALLALFGSTSMFAVSSPQTVNLPGAANYSFDDDDEPEVKARVARISFLSGEAKIKRNGLEEWEKAVLNLPLVEGDEIATDSGSRVEIQFDKNSHARLDENAFLRIVSLKDEAIALSLSLGTMAVRVTAFDKDKTSFEIDAPKTTLALQRSGSYRVDAGRDGDSEIVVAAREGGEARVYSDNAGFTLKNNRSARIFIDGPNVGEWASGDASRLNDDFESWVVKRELDVQQSLNTAYYDKYYDNDIYGADDLNTQGEWLDISGYGQVWRPYSSSISRYNDWSPYRYGQWRWMPPYGWIWVNDEPWGWATYHHGRWFDHGGHWYWSPYSYYRPRRSWWFPALVVINIFGGNTCWYPLSYRHRWRNYNPHHGGVRNPKGGIRDPLYLGGPRKQVPYEVANVPIKGIVFTPTATFGTSTKPYKSATPELTKSILSRKEIDPVLDVLPEYKDVSKRISREIVAEKPRIIDTMVGTKIGAGIRKADKPMDAELREKTVLGGRAPRTDVIQTTEPANPRKPGVFERPTTKSDGGKVVFTPRDSPPAEVKQPPRKESPVRVEPPKEQPRYTPPPVKETPRYTPPVKETPRYDPPPSKPSRVEPQPSKPSRVEPPQKSPPAKDSGDGKKVKPID